MSKYYTSSSLVEASKKAAILEKDEEFFLINDWRDNRNRNSLQKILKFVLLTLNILNFLQAIETI